MNAASEQDLPAPRRARGRPPRVSRASIVEAAQGMSADELTMQAVADRLGVDRSTINYHFTDRDELFSVVASATLGAALASYDAPASTDWRDWVSGYMRSVHSALMAHAATVLYVRLPLGSDARALAPVEGLIGKLSEAGFDDGTIAHAVAFISEVIHATAQNETLVARSTHPQGVELVRFLDSQPDEAVPGLRNLMTYDPIGHAGHFEFTIGMVVAGLESRLPVTG